MLVKILASGFGSGFSPLMPGTCGTLIALPIVIYFNSNVSNHITYQVLYSVLVALIGYLCTLQCIKTDHSKKDPQWIVIDEWAGIFITFIGIYNFSFAIIVSGFLLFRFFDMIKPWPIRQVEKLEGAFGIMADDILAGVMACICLHAIIYFRII